MEKFLQTISSLNDETRIKLLYFIKKHGPLCVCDLQNSFEMLQSRLSRHLKILKDAGFLDVQRDGRWAYYFIKIPLDPFKTETLKEIQTLKCNLPALEISSSDKQACDKS